MIEKHKRTDDATHRSLLIPPPRLADDHPAASLRFERELRAAGRRGRRASRVARFELGLIVEDYAWGNARED